MAQTISLDPKTWATVRIMAFERSTSASKLVAQAVDEFLARELAPDKASPMIAASEARRREGLAATKAGIGGTIVKSHQDGGTRVIDEVRLMEVSVSADDMPWGPSSISSVVPTAVIPPMEKELRATSVSKTFKATGEAVIGPDALPPPAVIKDPKEVGAAVRAVAAGREFHPVPKPVSTKKPRR